ncbi:MAG: PLP-dependent aminotransferase family protein [Gammaproteobacteria bacterium]|nr:PLP-dependent aminotransferase family protein [Gammaproteobacteria bacterium]MBU1492267.1 PLP-dependent aminotransferase family protein [Gammaproteobacteria bacterium]MBU2066955.1 PLP-dependent aminotransferase family protein [Gammaproteobacteria bacterium]MBU2139006.1 PLP-dependent aminotransferase family protein [Gammaproteobacteria bacterium]MBU2218769.1 PLP-dependent aminotransferase family protein [Gammaproteobacteria bacterium]
MIDHIYHLDFDPQRGLQEQLRESLVSAILGRGFPADEPLPSCRKLSQQLSISRNTVALVYESLLDNGYLVSRPRSGYYLHPDYCGQAGEAVLRITPLRKQEHSDEPAEERALDWATRLRMQPSLKHGVLRPSNWTSFTYPFIYGQPISDVFPLERWREVSRNNLRAERDQSWLGDRFDRDDDMLIEQLRTRVLPKRGIWARADEILVTLGSQNALYLLASLLMSRGVTVGMENPGFRDAMSIFDIQGARVQLQDVDADGLVVDARLDSCEYLYVTPGHQVPTGVAMSAARRGELLRQIRQHDQVLIEDDYDAEFNLDNHPLPALKASDSSGRVIYLSSLSKAFAPGLRIGYMVADAELIDELRALRRLMYRHPPLNNQRMLAEFLAQGHYDAHLRRFREEHCRRRELLYQALRSDLADCQPMGSPGASACWLAAPRGVDTQRLAWAAAQQSVLIESGAQFFLGAEPAPTNFMRLGFHAIDAERIRPGVQKLGEVLARL